MEVAIQLQEALDSLAGFVVPADFERFRQHIDPAWIEEALDATGTASVRRRRLPAEQAIWPVIGMALLRQESIERVVMMLGLALPTAGGDTRPRAASRKPESASCCRASLMMGLRSGRMMAIADA